MVGEEVYVVGGANSAGQAALHLARYARRVTLVVRAESLDAGMSHYLVRGGRGHAEHRRALGTEVVGGGGDGRLEHLVLRDRGDGTTETVEADGLFLLDRSPPEHRLAAGGDRAGRTRVLLHRRGPGDDGSGRSRRSRFSLETSMPGVFAAGDVRHGSVNRVASAVGEGSIAIQLVHELFAADKLSSGRSARQARPAPVR